MKLAGNSLGAKAREILCNLRISLSRFSQSHKEPLSEGSEDEPSEFWEARGLLSQMQLRSRLAAFNYPDFFFKLINRCTPIGFNEL